MKTEINLLIFFDIFNAFVNKFCRSQCYRDFKNIIKMSPYEYLIHYRLMKSIDYLLESYFNITEISEKVDTLLL